MSCGRSRFYLLFDKDEGNPLFLVCKVAPLTPFLQAILMSLKLWQSIFFFFPHLSRPFRSPSTDRNAIPMFNRTVWMTHLCRGSQPAALSSWTFSRVTVVREYNQMFVCHQGNSMRLVCRIFRGPGSGLAPESAARGCPGIGDW